MKLAGAHIRGYRCIADLEIGFDELTALVGSGGVGKSTVLNALEWFFHGGDLEERDRHLGTEEDAEPVEDVVVAVTFTDLTATDKEVLGDYVEGATTTLTRSWSEADGEKLSGTAMAFPGFQALREITSARDFRKAYVKLFNEQDEDLGLPEPARSAEQIKTDLEIWERENPTRCKVMPRDARHLFGFTGTATLASRFDYVLVSATASAPQELSDRRGGTLSRLLSILEELGDSDQERIAEAQFEAQTKVASIVGEARGGELVSISSGLTKRVREYFPGAAVKLEDRISPPRPPEISVRALVSDRAGLAVDPDLQGHGLQRALVIGLLHEIAEHEAKSQADEKGAEPRTLMLAIEEPELYQHPLQARALAATLESLSRSAGGRTIQVAYSTHSPYFSRPALFSDLRLCRRGSEESMSCVAANPDAIAAAIAGAGYATDAAERVERALADSLREAIFAQAVLLCEGSTDVSVMEGVGDLAGGFDRDGVAVAQCSSKSALIIAVAILRQLDIPFLALFDGDAAPANKSEEKLNRQILTICDEGPEEWPAREVRLRSANFADKLETDLADIWPEFDETRREVAKELGVKDSKKDDRVYREAVARAGDPPDFLVEVAEAVREMAR